MPRPAIALVLAALAFAGCDAATTRATVEGLTWDNVSTDTAFKAEEAAFELPFTRGVIAIVATERGELRTYRLYPCLSGGGVCLNSPQGPASAVQRGQRHYIVAGPAGRTFFLRPGGGGTLRTPQGDVPLAWNAYINGIPAWPAPIGIAVPRSEPSQSAFRP
jgi:hypothetical protein